MLPFLVSQLLCFLPAASLLPSTASADTGYWMFPPIVQNAPLPTFESQDTIDASWTSELVAPVLTLFCYTSSPNAWSINFKSPAPVLPNGSYAIPLNTVEYTDATCHLNLEETNGPLIGNDNSSNSGGFFVNVQSDRSATTWSASIAAATTSLSAPASAPTTTTSLSTPSPPSATPSAAAARATSKPPTPPTGLSSGAKAGIGVGVGVALGGVLALTLLAGLLRARRKRRPSPPPEMMQKQDHLGGAYVDGDENGMISKSDRGRVDPQAAAVEKDGFSIARMQKTARELC